MTTKPFPLSLSNLMKLDKTNAIGSQQQRQKQAPGFKHFVCSRTQGTEVSPSRVLHMYHTYKKKEQKNPHNPFCKESLQMGKWFAEFFSQIAEIASQIQ
jgi:hypothetical protein